LRQSRGGPALSRQNRILTIDTGTVYRAPGQAGPGNDINAGSPGSQKAPTWSPASLVAIRASASRAASRRPLRLRSFATAQEVARARWRRCFAFSLALRLLARIVVLALMVFIASGSNLDGIGHSEPARGPVCERMDARLVQFPDKQIRVNYNLFRAKTAEGAAPVWVRRVEPHNSAAGHGHNANDLATGLRLPANANAAPDKREYRGSRSSSHLRRTTAHGLRSRNSRRQ